MNLPQENWLPCSIIAKIRGSKLQLFFREGDNLDKHCDQAHFFQQEPPAFTTNFLWPVEHLGQLPLFQVMISFD